MQKYFAYHIALIIELPVAKYELARYKEKLGRISTNFVLDGERLIHGNELLVKIFKDYPVDRFYKVREYKLETVLNLIQILEKEKSLGLKNALYDFIGYLVFDCLIANQDRHHENWGFVVEKEQKLRLALSYDHASGFVNKILKLDIEDIQRILDCIPNEFIKKYQKDFAIEILKENISILEELKKEICQNAR